MRLPAIPHRVMDRRYLLGRLGKRLLAVWVIGTLSFVFLTTLRACVVRLFPQDLAFYNCGSEIPVPAILVSAFGVLIVATLLADLGRPVLLGGSPDDP